MDLVLIALYCSHSVYGPGTNCIVLTVCMDLVLIVLFSQYVWTWYQLYCSHSVYGPGTNCIALRCSHSAGE